MLDREPTSAAADDALVERTVMDPQDRPGWNPPAPGTTAGPGLPEYSAPEIVQAGARRSRVGMTVAVAAIAVGALGVAGTAYASSTSPSPSPSTSTDPGNGPGLPGQGERHGLPGYGAPGQGQPDGDRDGAGPMGGHRGGMGMRGPGMGIHGTFVVPKADGGYQTVHTQRGTVTAVSATSLSLTSEDGFTASYVVTADTGVNAQRDGIATVEVGDEVVVIGTEDSGTVTAVQIMDRTRIGDALKRLAPPIPSPSETGSTT
jgi:hypothetical protein